METPAFVARERELQRLDWFLAAALAGLGQVCFVSGEAGSGKTALVTEFARRAEAQHPELVAAFGQGDAQTGMGDPYLPFREVLLQLTGDADTQRRVVSQENASRLGKLVTMSVRFLVELAPDLVGLFVPGAGLAMKAAKATADKAGWLGKLEKLAQRPKAGEGLGSSGLDQNLVFEQYTRFVTTLAEKTPLLLILDDLQWADPSSVALLFRLGRRIAQSRILLVGTYRPEELTQDSRGGLHRLEKVIAELKRYQGEVELSLDATDEADRRGFVDSLLDGEPNALDEAFRHALLQHTDGHALFTVELLRAMQERGDLVRDAQGRWMAGPALDWGALPARVEGVIEERIGRLAEELRAALTVASVEGEEFTAEVVAQVRAVDARELVRRLSQELQKEHRLVSAQGLRRLAARRLALYRFQHNLFQTYLYNGLDAVERAYLHGDVGNVLEELYGEQTDEVAVQLARHFEEAGVVDKAVRYLRRSGELAAARYANEEAVAYLGRALELTPERESGERYTLLLAREQVYNLQGERELQAQDLASLQALAQILGDDAKRIELALLQAAYANAVSNYPAAIAAAQESARLAQVFEDTRSQAMACFEWGSASQNQGDNEMARCQLEQALSLSRASGSRQVEAATLRMLGTLAHDRGDYACAQTYFEESLRISHEDGDRRGESQALWSLGSLFFDEGCYAKTRKYAERNLPIVRETGDRLAEARLLNQLGTCFHIQGDLQTARGYYEQSRGTFHDIGERHGEIAPLNNLGILHTWLGDLAAGRCFLEEALLLAREIGSQAREASTLFFLSTTLACQGDYSAAIECCEQSLQLARELGDRWAEAHALGKLGTACDCVGDYLGAKQHCEDSLQIARTIGFRQGEAEALAKLGLLCHHLGEDQAARDYSQRAVKVAQELNFREFEAYAITHLAHALTELGHLAQAAEAYRHSVALRRDMGQPHMAMESLAGLARVCLIQENPREAQALVEEILAHLESHTLEGTEEPIRVHLTCYRTLAADRDPRASELLNTAYRLLQGRAAKIGDQEMRRSFLENVAANREIVAEYERSQQPQ